MNTERFSFPSSGWQRLGLALIGVFFWISCLDFPGPVQEGIDPSWQAVLVEAHLQGWQFGRDVIFTYGPWGWLTSDYFLPDALGGKFVWELGGKLLLAFGLVGMSLALPPFRRGCFLLALPIFGTLYPDVLFFLWMTLATLTWLFRAETRAWLLTGTLVTLALFAQIKFSYALFAAIAVSLAAASWWWRGRWPRGVALIAGLGSAYLGWWLAAGQNLANLPAYWSFSWEISRGYPDAMAFGEPWKVFFIGALVTALSLGYVAWAGWTHPDRRFGWPATLFLAAAWGLAWKHGFTRADQHVMGFFGFGLLTAVATPGLLCLESRARWYDICPLLCLLGLGVFYGKGYAASAWPAWEPMVNGIRSAASLPTLRAKFMTALAREQRAADRPALREVVGAGTVDLLNYDQGLLLLNQLRYRPRPVLQSYSAYTPALLAQNLRFFQSESAPDYVVVKVQGFDGRNPMQDDSLLLAELPHRYKVAQVTDDYVLVRKKPEPSIPAELTRRTVLDRRIGLDEPVLLPAARDQVLWLQLTVHRSPLARIRSLLYKPPQGYVVLTDDSGREARYRIVTLAAEEGFIVQPRIETARDYADLVEGRGNHWVTSLRFEAESAGEKKFWDGVSVRISALSGLPVKTSAP